MSASTPPNATGHKYEFLLSYVEGLLRPDEAAEVEEHLNACPQCSSEVAELRALILTFRANKRAFCPDPWEVYEFVHYGTDPERKLAGHLEACSACSELAGSLTSESEPELMPSALLRKLKQRLSDQAVETVAANGGFAGILERFFRWVRIPALAAGAAAAVVLLVILLYPKEIPESVVALSSVAWEQAPRPKEFAPSRPRIAVILAFKGFDQPVKQEEIDSFYRALVPSMAIQERVQILPPAALKEAIHDRAVKARDQKQLLTTLSANLGVSQAVIVTVEGGPQGQGSRVASRLVDTASGAALASTAEEGVAPNELEQAVKQSVFGLLVADERRDDTR